MILIQRRKPLRAKTGLKAKKGLNRVSPYNRKTPPKRKHKKPVTKKEKKAERKGLKIPSKARRGQFGDDYQVAIKKHGRYCNDPTCGKMAQQMHHVCFKSQSGRGVWRNACPLCTEHHEKCHDDFQYAEYWRQRFREAYGDHFYKDKWDLWVEGLIEEPNNEQYEDFMIKEVS